MSIAMTPDRVLNSVEGVCRDATTSDELLSGIADTIHRAIPHDGAVWFGVDPLTLLGTAPSRVERLDPGLCDTFWHLEFHEQDVCLFADLAHGEGAGAMRHSLDNRMGRSPRYRDFLQPQGYQDELRGVFRSGESTWGMVGLYRESAHQPFSAEDVSILKSVSRPIGAALCTYVRQSAPWLTQPSAPGLLIVNPAGHIIASNNEAMNWLRELWPCVEDSKAELDPNDLFSLRNEKLQVPTALYALISRSRAFASGRESAPARLRLRDARDRWLVLHASTLAKSEADAADDVAIVIEAAKSAEIAPIIIEAYSLTRRERDVVAAIAQGGSTTEIAAKLFLSPHTVRDHIKTVFEKVGVSSRGELVAKLFGEHYADPLHASMVHVD
ncbi:MAG: helix-turn-helix transcriptional regulator [Acidimicrobiales bacterium]|nr:helix-turn-helix transcriptional regulator [Acidimicrobiales bacterium]